MFIINFEIVGNVVSSLSILEMFLNNWLRLVLFNVAKLSR